MPVTNDIWDDVNDTVLMETDDSGNPTVVYNHEPGPFGGLISERRGNQTRYYHYDGLGSTRQLTDDTGQVTDSLVTGFPDSHTEIPGFLDTAQFFHHGIELKVGLAHSRPTTVSAVYAIDAMRGEP